MLGGALLGNKREQSVTQQTQQRSPEETAALQGANTAGAGLQAGATTAQQTGAGFLNTGGTQLNQAGSYYDTLLRGNRSAMNLATAQPRAAISDVYRGAERNLDRAGVRGAARDVASADLGRERAGTISSLITGVQPAAAAGLADVGAKFLGEGTAQTSQALAGRAQAGSIFANLLEGGGRNRWQATQTGMEAGEKTSQGIGSFLFDIINGFGKKKGGILGSRSTTPSFSSWMPS